MKWCLFLLLTALPIISFAQEKHVDGIVFDKSSKDRIAQVHIWNASTGRDVFNNLKGEYTINARVGDILIFQKQDYYDDTVTVKNYSSQAIYLAPTSIQLHQVDINGHVLTPEQQLAATKRDYTKIYGVLDDKDILSVSPGQGAGVSIDALYNIFSRSGRNATHLRNEIQSDYYQNVIDYRYNRTFVTRITGLKDPQLTEFMQRYRPGYWFVVNASDYDFITYIRSNYKRFLRRPQAYSLQPLQPGK